jgi:hypothetical protein
MILEAESPKSTMQALVRSSWWMLSHAGSISKRERSHSKTGSQREGGARLALFITVLSQELAQCPTGTTLIPAKDAPP